MNYFDYIKTSPYIIKTMILTSPEQCLNVKQLEKEGNKVFPIIPHPYGVQISYISNHYKN